MSRAAYEIHALGKVPPRLVADFEGVRVTADPAGTTIRVELADEAELHGLLDALRRGGFLLLEVRREQPYDAPGPDTPGPNTPGPNTPGPDTPGPNTPGPNTPGEDRRGEDARD